MASTKYKNFNIKSTNENQNKCRLCKRIFCCQTCRSRHETKFHNVISECDICIYGKIWCKSLLEATTTLVDHIENTHFPMHCNICNMVFENIKVLSNHSRCNDPNTLKVPKTPLTPYNEHSSDQYLSVISLIKTLNGECPKIDSHITTVITSTPMQEIIDNNLAAFTPCENILKFEHKSSLKSISALSDSKKSYRKVTFSETTQTSAKLRNPPKFFDLNSPINNHPEESEYSYYSMPDMSEPKSKHANGSTLFETARSEIDITKKEEMNVHNEYCMMQNEYNNESLSKQNHEQESNVKNNLWYTMKNAVSSMIHGISMSITSQHDENDSSDSRIFENDDESSSIKKRKLFSIWDEEESPPLKKRKLINIKCRPFIKPLSLMYEVKFKEGLMMVDKSTQTEA